MLQSFPPVDYIVAAQWLVFVTGHEHLMVTLERTPRHYYSIQIFAEVFTFAAAS